MRADTTRTKRRLSLRLRLRTPLRLICLQRRKRLHRARTRTVAATVVAGVAVADVIAVAVIVVVVTAVVAVAVSAAASVRAVLRMLRCTTTAMRGMTLRKSLCRSRPANRLCCRASRSVSIVIRLRWLPRRQRPRRMHPPSLRF